ncbi:hypothetical protein BAE44_0001336 [Dichanthelium oligosanthes]|uniref:Uncharacterized protein n=1 Tax=Dichanthelium oligosanthes TaxID=888268 RepID=A0A1E5WJN9_9POAL|nr:hypothetical protein BAE44_0001336 [Dichanthelium oligosanthes]
MASSPSQSSSPNPVGLWFCQISSGLQGRWQSGRAEPQKNGAGGSEARQARAADAAGSEVESVRRTAASPATTCRREAMQEATVYLLLDRFAPS